MFPTEDIEGFEKYWRRRKPGKSTALHYASDVRIFFQWAAGYGPEDISVHVIDWFMEWQQGLGRAPSTVRRRIISLRMFFDYYSYRLRNYRSSRIFHRTIFGRKRDIAP